MFANVTPTSGSGDPGYGLGVAVSDYDNDGFDDIYITNFGADVLLHNNGDGTFTDVTSAAGVADGTKFGAGAAFLDIDGDGDVDLFSANYVEFSFQRHAERAPRSFPYPPGPADYAYARNSLFRNNGDGTFTDISAPSGIAAVPGPSMGIVCGDFDEDGDTDLFVGCDGAPNHLYINDGRGVFVEQALLAGVAFDVFGVANGSMGTEVGDVDNDGKDDILITNYANQHPTLYRNRGSGAFDDVSRASRVGLPAVPHTNWGVGMVDFDNDGDRDVFISNGHMLKRARTIEPLTDFKVPNCLMLNDGTGRFSDETARAGSGLKIVESSRGTGFDDLDNDGDVDCVVLNCVARANLLINRSVNKHHWLELELRGTRTNRAAVGARVKVLAGSLVRVAEVRSGRGYQSHYGTRLHFGLGTQERIDRIEVAWLGGGKDVYEGIAVDRITTLLERFERSQARNEKDEKDGKDGEDGEAP
jgi:hypothetical protein